MTFCFRARGPVISRDQEVWERHFASSNFSRYDKLPELGSDTDFADEREKGRATKLNL